LRTYLLKGGRDHNYNVAQDENLLYEGWNFNRGNYLFTTDTK